MIEGEDRFLRFVPLLRRVVILLAVLAAVPVILWTITAFVRAYVGPPKLPTFHQLAATTPLSASATDAATGSIEQQSATPEPARSSDAPNATMEANAAPSNTPDVAGGAKGPLLGDRPSAVDPNPLASTPRMAAASTAPATILSPVASANLKGTDISAAAMPAAAAPLAATPDATTTNMQTTAAQQPPAAAEQAANAMPAEMPLSGRIPLPRRRPHVLAEANVTQVAQTRVPVPRPRPDGVAPAAPTEPASTSPLEFLQNIFH
jgi:hypothetical protein